MHESYDMIGNDIYDKSGRKVGKMLSERDVERMNSFADILGPLAAANEGIKKINASLRQNIKTNASVLKVLSEDVPAGLAATEKSLGNIMEGCRILAVTHDHARKILHGEGDILQQKLASEKSGKTYKNS